MFLFRGGGPFLSPKNDLGCLRGGNSTLSQPTLSQPEYFGRIPAIGIHKLKPIATHPLLVSQKQNLLSSLDCTRPANVNQVCCGVDFLGFFLFRGVFVPCLPCLTRY